MTSTDQNTQRFFALLTPTFISACVAALLVAAIFGFFYAWVCSTMWGLDAADPRVAIEAMQAMNASVRNPVFMPAFFLTPVALGITALLAWQNQAAGPAALFLSAGVLYTVGALLFTAMVNVPMNEALAATPVPQNIDDAAQIWSDYSSRWQIANISRTVVTGICVLLTTVAIAMLGQATLTHPASASSASTVPVPAQPEHRAPTPPHSPDHPATTAR
ncbi:MAG: DUF1772 domain-containing protein [Beutenbergiaceae bacterium]